jgi:hypothetical protein
MAGGSGYSGSRSIGHLYIFEIKRWQGDKSNLLQVIRYGQIFGQYDYTAIEECFRRSLGDQSVSLQLRHQTHFELHEPIERRQFNANQKFVLVTAGSDVQTLQAVRYWRSKGLPIELKAYHVFKDEDRFYVTFDSFAPASRTIRGWPAKAGWLTPVRRTGPARIVRCWRRRRQRPLPTERTQ